MGFFVTKCFLVEYSGLVDVHLHVLQSVSSCPFCGRLSHESMVLVDRVKESQISMKNFASLTHNLLWPVKADCGMSYDRPSKSFHFSKLYHFEDRLVAATKLPPGAIWHVPPPHTGRPLRDRSLVVRCPDGTTWPLMDGGGWHGDPPGITVEGPIVTSGYSGYLIDGSFTEDDAREIES